ncbi:transposase [Corynebacterium striatum]
MAKLINELGTSTTDANDLVRGMVQASITRGLNAEMDAHLGYPSGDRDAKTAAGTDNHRNGTYPKTVDSNYGPVTVDVPKDRAGTFLPTMVPKGSRRLTDVDDMIVSLYAGGMTIRDIRHHMATAMRVDISHETISAVTDAVLEEFADSELGEKYPRSVKVWQDAWERFIPFLQFPPAARKVIYTTNSIESFNNELRKATRNRVQFTNDESALKTLWLMICNIEDKRAAKRAKQGKRATASARRLVEGGKVSGWKQAIN